MNNGWGPYGRDSYHSTYGNEMFLGSRQSNLNAGQNFLEYHKMPVLSRGNFNPEFIGVLSRKQNAAKNQKLLLLIKEKWIDIQTFGINFTG